MGPTNVALVQLFRADQELREAQTRLDAATKNVRIQQRRVLDLTEKVKLAQHKSRELQSRGKQLDLELKARDAHIEKLRTQQQQARNNKEYQAFLVEINTHKVDRGKIEDEALKSIEFQTANQAELAELQTQLQSEQVRLTELQGTIDHTTEQLRLEVARLQDPRDEAYQALPPNPRIAFDRLADRFDGEALSAIAKPDDRVEQYICTVCNIDLVRDVYNRLHSRDEMVFCRSCGRILYIPDDLTPDKAVHKPKPVKERKPASSTGRRRKADLPGAAVAMQSDAVDVLRSMQEDELPTDPAESPSADPAEPAESADSVESTEPAATDQAAESPSGQ